jgi:hypothetical protein
MAQGEVIAYTYHTVFAATVVSLWTALVPRGVRVKKSTSKIFAKPHIGMPHSCEMVLVKKLELEATELNLKTNNQKVHTPALFYK